MRSGRRSQIPGAPPPSLSFLKTSVIPRCFRLQPWDSRMWHFWNFHPAGHRRQLRSNNGSDDAIRSLFAGTHPLGWWPNSLGPRSPTLFENCAMKELLSISLAVFSLSGPHAFAAQVESLGHLPDGSFSPSLISQDGRLIVGSVEDPINRLKIGVWTEDDGLTVLDQGSSIEFEPFGLSASGDVLVGHRLPNPASLRKAIRWDLSAGTYTDLGTLPFYYRATATAVSADGLTVLGTCGVGAALRTFRWTAAGGMQDLDPTGQLRVTGSAINADGSVIVGSLNGAPSLSSCAVLWTQAGGITPIPGLPDGFSEAIAVSDDGTRVVGTIVHPNFPSGIFYYRAGLGPFPVILDGGRYFGEPPLLSADGSTVAMASQGSASGAAHSWTFSGGARPIHSSLPLRPLSISADGQVISGFYQFGANSNDLQAFRWSAPSDQFRTLDPITPGALSIGAVTSRDGTVIAGPCRLNFVDERQAGARWSRNGGLGQPYCTQTVPNSFGSTSSMGLTGSNVVAHGELLLGAKRLPSNAFGFFLVSETSGFVPVVPGSQGSLCLGGAIGRFVGPGQIQQANFLGEVSLLVDPRSLPSPQQGTFSPAPGQSLYFQFWYRDANPLPTSNFSTGITQRFF